MKFRGILFGLLVVLAGCSLSTTETEFFAVPDQECGGDDVFVEELGECVSAPPPAPSSTAPPAVESSSSTTTVVQSAAEVVEGSSDDAAIVAYCVFRAEFEAEQASSSIDVSNVDGVREAVDVLLGFNRDAPAPEEISADNELMVSSLTGLQSDLAEAGTDEEAALLLLSLGEDAEFSAAASRIEQFEDEHCS